MSNIAQFPTILFKQNAGPIEIGETIIDGITIRFCHVTEQFLDIEFFVLKKEHLAREEDIEKDRCIIIENPDKNSLIKAILLTDSSQYRINFPFSLECLSDDVERLNQSLLEKGLIERPAELRPPLNNQADAYLTTRNAKKIKALKALCPTLDIGNVRPLRLISISDTDQFLHLIIHKRGLSRSERDFVQERNQRLADAFNDYERLKVFSSDPAINKALVDHIRQTVPKMKIPGLIPPPNNPADNTGTLEHNGGRA